MRGGFASATLLVAAFAIAVVGPPTLAGLPATEISWFLTYGAVVLWLTGWAADRSRGARGAVVSAVAMWVVFVAAATALYAKRDEAVSRLREIADETGIGQEASVVVEGGEVTVTRRVDGSFLVPAQVNGRPATFIFDTGASAVVLTAETAAALGLPVDKLSYRVPVLTANGRTMTAPVVLDRMTIGPIVLTRVRALVSPPGVLHQNLLGATVLDRLHSYEVRNGRLMLRARAG